MWKRRAPDQLTAREQEVLDLIRRGLTNEEIAQRLGITVAGAKYHVSQILSKLGVATREEAAAIALREPRRWWARWPLWAKIAGAGTVVAAVVGLAVLAWGVWETRGDEEDFDAALAVQEVYSRIEQAITRPGYMLRSTREVREGQGSAASGDPAALVQMWVDPLNERMRIEFHATSESIFRDFVALVVEGDIYMRTADGQIDRGETPGSFCPGTEKYLISAFLGCPQASSIGTLSVSVEPTAEYRGRATVLLVVEDVFISTFTLPPPTPGTPLPTKAGESVETRTVERIHLAPDTFLPVAHITELYQDGALYSLFTETYDHTWVPVENVDPDPFDPGALSVNDTSAPTP